MLSITGTPQKVNGFAANQDDVQRPQSEKAPTPPPAPKQEDEDTEK